MKKVLYHIPMWHSPGEFGGMRNWSDHIGHPAQDIIQTLGMPLCAYERALTCYWATVEEMLTAQVIPRLGNGAKGKCFVEGWAPSWDALCFLTRTRKYSAHNGAYAQTMVRALKKRGWAIYSADDYLCLERAVRMIRQCGRMRKRVKAFIPQGLYKIVIEDRDHAIAARLDRLVQRGEVALLFLGALHRAPVYLSENEWEFHQLAPTHIFPPHLQEKFALELDPNN